MAGETVLARNQLCENGQYCISLYVDKSIFSSTHKLSTELYLVNKLLSQCMGKLVLSSVSSEKTDLDHEIASDTSLGSPQKTPPLPLSSPQNRNPHCTWRQPNRKRRMSAESAQESASASGEVSESVRVNSLVDSLKSRMLTPVQTCSSSLVTNVDHAPPKCSKSETLNFPPETARILRPGLTARSPVLDNVTVGHHLPPEFPEPDPSASIEVDSCHPPPEESPFINDMLSSSEHLSRIVDSFLNPTDELASSSAIKEEPDDGLDTSARSSTSVFNAQRSSSAAVSPLASVPTVPEDPTPGMAVCNIQSVRPDDDGGPGRAPTDRGGMMSCQHCSYSTDSNHKLRRHFVFRHSDIRLFQCASCEYACKQKSDLKKHYIQKHKMTHQDARALSMTQ